MDCKSRSSTCIAPINIAVIKYWGKSDEEQIIPLNDSISITLDTDYMFTKTTATISPEFTQDSIVLNNEQGSGDGVRFQNCLSEVRKLAASSKHASTVEKSTWKVAIVSENNFPTKAGLASSASGYACLVFTLAQLYELESHQSELSALARRGSGSACRSLFGGFVRWFHDSQPCIARPIAEAEHWPELRCLVAVVSNTSKSVGSTEGMRRSAETSKLLEHRVKNVVRDRIEDIKMAILEKNFVKFAEITMRDSNQFHAICLDTYPPLFYMNSTSQAIIQLVHRYNQIRQSVKVAYTFDAGPNAVLFLEQAEISRFASVFYSVFGSTPHDQFFRGKVPDLVDPTEDVTSLVPEKALKGQVQYTIVCHVGQGPKNIDPTG
ncbi:diphosphomevalonate decarboxylase-like [Daphnia pulicaria]|uniref:diphosphomevalonate decarboxylase-like n=1 Tax=Daphnia pulicaria TaxID=35523 RepID=UPI001EEB0221|nr:diphosphomevalonate decarboxylase-like [Daphnia pulicaria]XP_046657443.1 diphosphomevalonate decarboxylase-like [Daphnia pulicaria]